MKQENIDAIKATIKTQFNHRLKALERDYLLANFSVVVWCASWGVDCASWGAHSPELKEATEALDIDKKYTEEEALNELFNLISTMRLVNAFSEVSIRRAQLYNVCLFFEKIALSLPHF